MFIGRINRNKSEIKRNWGRYKCKSITITLHSHMHLHAHIYIQMYIVKFILAAVLCRLTRFFSNTPFFFIPSWLSGILD